MRQRDSLGIEYGLLGLLAARPRHGYDLHQALQDPEGLGKVWRLKQGHAYALLARLEEEGLVAAQVEAQESRPPRKVYSLTEAGREAFEGWRSSTVGRGRQLRQEFLAKLYFSLEASPEAALALVAAQRKACAVWPEVEAESGPAVTAFGTLVDGFRMSQVQAARLWLEELEKALGAPQGATSADGL